MLSRLVKWLTRTQAMPEPSRPPAVVALREPPGSGTRVRLGNVLRALRQSSGLLEEPDLVQLGLALCTALERLPAPRSLLLSPDQVLLSREGAVTLRVRSRQGRSFRWLSPEAIRGVPLTAASEVYGVCALLFASAAGRSLFDAFESDLDLLLAVRDGQFVGPLTRFRPGLSTPLVELIDRGLRRTGAPLPDVTALSQALSEFPSSAPASLGARAFALAPPQPARRRTYDDDALLEAIASGDESARHVYADVLEERGLGDHATWLRLESRLQSGDGDHDALLLQLAQLKPRLQDGFLASVGRATVEGCPLTFGLRCTKQWSELEPTSDLLRRHCPACDSDVHFVTTVEAATERAQAGECVAIDASVGRSSMELEFADQPTARVGQVIVPRDADEFA